MIICTFIQKKYYRKWTPYTFLQFPCLYIKLSRCCFYYVKTKEPFGLQAWKIIKAHACKGEALDCFLCAAKLRILLAPSLGNHGHPLGDNLVLCTSMHACMTLVPVSMKYTVFTWFTFF